MRNPHQRVDCETNALQGGAGTGAVLERPKQGSWLHAGLPSSQQPDMERAWVYEGLVQPEYNMTRCCQMWPLC